MKISGFSVKRPVFTSMVTLIVVTLGFVSVARLPIDLMPEVTLPRLTVSTTYENASPAEVEELITRPIERAIAAVPGVEEITSTSAEGISSVSVGFVWGTDLDAATNDVRDRLERVITGLPDDADRPRIRKFDATAFPIMMIGVSSPMDPIELRTFIDERIQHRLERVAGVASVDTWGGHEREIRIEADPDRLRAFGLSLDELVEAVREANITLPAGDIDEGMYQVTLRAPGLFTSLDQVRQTVVALRGDRTPVYLEQVAEVIPTHREVTRIIRINGEPGVRLAIQKQSGTNTVEVARGVKEEIRRINSDFTQAQLIVVRDTSEYIERSIQNIVRSIALGGLLAVVILLFFLRSFLSTLVIATAIPVSIIATFTLIYFGGLTLNLMTLGGLALGVGMMVDSSIVVLENIFRLRQRQKQAPQQAAINGAGEVTAAIIASTLTTLVIFLPLVFLQGTTGILFRQLAFVIAFSLVCSLLVALTIVPMLAARLPEGTGRGEAGRSVGARLAHWARERFHRLEEGYAGFLDTALNHRLLVTSGAFLLLAATMLLVPRIGQEFMPQADEGEVRVSAEMAVGTRLDVMDRKMREIEAIVLPRVPELQNSQVSVGSSMFRPGSAASGELRLSLVPMAQRSRSSAEVADDVRSQLTGIPGVTIRVREGQGLFLMRMMAGGDERLSIEVRGHDLPTLDALAAQAREAISEIPGVTDVRVSREAGVPQQMVRIDRDRAADFGVSVSRIARTLRTAVGGTTAGQFREGGDEVRMQVRLRDAEQMTLEDVLDVTVPSANGPVALRAVADLEFELGPIQIERKEQQRVAYVAANIAGRDLGSIARDVRAALDEIPLPAYHGYFLGGDYEEQQKAFFELLISLFLSLALVFMVMACLYEGFRDPVIVMFSVPLAAIGALLILFLTGTTLNVQSFIGLIMLGGIVVNNAILIVDQATRLRRDEGWLVRAAVLEAGRRRLRPVLMTSLTTMFALTPLALGWGEGGEAQAPLARAVIGGLFSSSMITLVVIPAVYTFFHRDRK